MTRPYVNFRPSQEMIDDIISISKATNMSIADVVRQLATFGLEKYKTGAFQMVKRTKPGSKKKLDKRFLRGCGLKISEKKAGRPVKFVGDSNATPRPPSSDRLLDKSTGETSND